MGENTNFTVNVDFILQKANVAQELDKIKVAADKAEDSLKLIKANFVTLEKRIGDVGKAAKKSFEPFAHSLKTNINESLKEAIKLAMKGGVETSKAFGKAAKVLGEAVGKRPSYPLGGKKRGGKPMDKTSFKDILAGEIDETKMFGEAMESLGLENEKFNKGLEQVKKSLGNFGKSIQGQIGPMAKFGRTIGFMGFIMSISAQRMWRTFSGVLKIFTGLTGEFMNVDRAANVFTNSVKALAMGGQLTDERMQGLLLTFDDTFQNSIDLAAQIAILQGYFEELKNAAIGPVIEALGDLTTDMDAVDWEAFKTDVESAADAFIDPLYNALAKVLGIDEEAEGEGGVLGKIGKWLNIAASAAGNFGAGIIEGGAALLTFMEDIGIINEEGGLDQFSRDLGKTIIPLIAIGVPLTIVGTLLSSLGIIVKTVVSAVNTLTPLFKIAGAGSLGLGLIVIAGLVGALIFWWDELKANWDNHVLPAIDKLKEALGGDEGIKGIMKGLKIFLKGAFLPFKAAIDVIILVIAALIEKLAAVITKIKNAIQWWKDLLGIKDKKKDYGEAGVSDEDTTGYTQEEINARLEADRIRRETEAENKRLLEEVAGTDYSALDEAEGRQFGGPIYRTGIYKLHRGEYVIPPGSSRSVAMGNIIVNVSGVNDPYRIAEEVSRIIGKKVRTSLVLP